MSTLKEMIDIAIKDSQSNSDEIEEARGYVVPRKKSELDEKSPANMKKRVALLKSVVNHLEAALGDFEKMPEIGLL